MLAKKNSIIDRHKKLPRVAVLSLRNVENHVARAGGYEYEDVIAEKLDEANILLPSHGSFSRHALRANSFIHRYSPIEPRLGFLGKQVALKQNHELFFFNPAQPRDLSYLSAVPDWRKHSRFAICCLQELWADDIPKLGHTLDILNKFDHITSPFYHTTEILRAHLSVPVTYLPWGVDTVLFNPGPCPPRRAIDFCCIGEIADTTHSNLIDYTDTTGRFYFYNTITGRHSILSHRAHRHNYANILKRSHFFLTYHAKIARKDERGTQKEFGLRYFEGTAAGTILLGDRVHNPAFDEYLAWPDSVIEAPFGTQDIVRITEQIEKNPDRIKAARRHNVIEALNRHDYLYRWEKVLQIAGMSMTLKMDTRRKKLTELAAVAQKTYF